MNCISCNIDLHPYYQKKYDGYCLNCINAGAAEKDEQIIRMERQLAAAERLYFAAKEGLGWLVAQEWDVSLSAIVALEKALEDYANAKDAK